MLPVRVKNVHADRPDTYNTVREAGGKLVCDCPEFSKTKPGSAPACNHTTVVIKEELDVRSEPGTEPQRLPGTLSVLVYRKPPIEAHIILGNPDEFSIRTVNLSCAEAQRRQSKIKKSTIHMGFIGPNQGRMSIRRLLLDWLQSAYYDRPICTAPQHFAYLPEEMGKTLRTEEERATERLYQVDTFDLYTTGWCRVCNESSGVPDVE